ncbi:MAG: 50S ribosomal protein L32 [Candidatus Paceibacterota bacterium]
MVVRMRATRAHRDNRRSHHALIAGRLSKCPNCNNLHLRHTVCANCGKYRGRQVLDVHSKLAKREKKVNEKQGA